MTKDERRDILAGLLKAIGVLRLNGERALAQKLDAIATQVEHPLTSRDVPAMLGKVE